MAAAGTAAATGSVSNDKQVEQTSNLRCRLETKAWPRKQELIGVIRQLSTEQAGMFHLPLTSISLTAA